MITTQLSMFDERPSTQGPGARTPARTEHAARLGKGQVLHYGVSGPAAACLLPYCGPTPLTAGEHGVTVSLVTLAHSTTGQARPGLHIFISPTSPPPTPWPRGGSSICLTLDKKKYFPKRKRHESAGTLRYKSVSVYCEAKKCLF